MEMKTKLKSIVNKKIVIIFLSLFLIEAYIPKVQAIGRENAVLLRLIEDKKVTINVNDQALEYILSLIKKQTGIGYAYQSKDIDKNKKFSLHVENKSVREALTILLKGSSYDFQITSDNILIIKRQKRESTVVDKTKDLVTIKGVVCDKAENPIIGATIIVGESTSGRGTATDIYGRFTLAVGNGEEITISSLGYKTEKRVIKKDLPNLSAFKIVLEEDVEDLDEVIVTGYQELDRRKATGAVTSLKMDDIKVAGLSTVDKMLEGHIPGMIFMQNSGQVGAAPRLRIRGTSTILGNQEPLWVVDGIIQNDPVNVDPAQLNDLDFVNLLGNAISGLNPDDIEQIDVLKDAAATAIYGARAANGVIVITTKKGKVGPPTVTYSVSGTFNERPHYSDKQIYLMNSRERVQVSREMFERQMDYKNIGTWMGYEKAVLDYNAGRISYDEYLDLANYYETINTDWFDLICDNTVSNKHTLSVSGGTDKIRYHTSVGYNNELGVIRGEKNNVLTTMAKINMFYDKFQMQFSMQSNHTNKAYTPSAVAPVDYAYKTSRAIPAFEEDGDYAYYLKGTSTNMRPFNILNEMDESSYKIKSANITTNLNLKYWIIPDLSLEGTFSISSGYTDEETVYTENSHYILLLKRDGPGDKTSTCPFGGELTTNNTRNSSYMARIQVNYNKYLDNDKRHNINVALGGELSSVSYNTVKKIERGYYPDRGKTFADIDGTDLYQTGYGAYRDWLAQNVPVITEKETNIISSYFTLTYSYLDKYIFNFNARTDASNQFGASNNGKLKPIWAVSARWNAKEDLFPDNGRVQDLSLKFSYGLQGNMLDNQTSKVIIKKGAYNSWFEDFTSTVSNFPNPDLKWETTHSYNVEMTFSLWNNLISGTLGYYYKKTTDAFLTKRVADINGVTNYVVNSGNVSNQGVEVTLSFQPFNQTVSANGKRGFVWRFDPQIGQVVNKLINQAINDKSNTVRDKVTVSDYLNGNLEIAGEPLGTFYSYQFKGLNHEDGSPMFYGAEPELAEELHERYLAMDDEEVMLEVVKPSGTRVPVLQGGINNYFGYRQWGLSLNFSYSLGNKIRMLKMCDANNISPYPEYNMRREFVCRWQRPGDEKFTNIPGLKPSDSYNRNWWDYNTQYYNFTDGRTIYDMYDLSDVRVVSGNYLKLSSASLRWNVPDDFCKYLRIKSAYLSVTGTNLFTIMNKDLKGQDPATQNGTSATINLSLRPTYSFSINVSF